MKAYLPIILLAAFTGLVIWYVCRKPKAPAASTAPATQPPATNAPAGSAQ